MKKSNLGFYFIILLILLIGLFNLYSMNRFHENNQVRIQIGDFIKNLDHLVIDLSSLINADNLDDYNEIKSNIEFRKSENDILHKRIEHTIHELNPTGNFDKVVDEFMNISNSLIDLQKETIDKDQEFAEKEKLEKSLRYEFIDLTDELNNIDLTNSVWGMRYYGKEALFQYKDKKHINEWQESILQIKEIIVLLNLQEERKEGLLKSLDSYQVIASEMGDIVIRQGEIENEEDLKIHELYDINSKLEEAGREISSKIKSQSESLARNTFWMILTIAGVGIIILVLFQKYFLYSKLEAKK